MNQEVFNEELYEKLIKREPKWYYGKCFSNQTEAKEKIENHYREISILLKEYGIKFLPDCYHKKRGSDKIELTKRVLVKGKPMNESVVIKKGSGINMKAKGVIDPEEKDRTMERKEEVIFTDQY